jgi:hypothetical protein
MGARAAQIFALVKDSHWRSQFFALFWWFWSTANKNHSHLKNRAVTK